MVKEYRVLIGAHPDIRASKGAGGLTKPKLVGKGGGAGLLLPKNFQTELNALVEKEGWIVKFTNATGFGSDGAGVLLYALLEREKRDKS